MNLFALALMAAVASGTGPEVDASLAQRATVVGVTSYGGYQPYVLDILLPSGVAARSVRSDAKAEEIGFHDFSIDAGEYRITYKCGSRRGSAIRARPGLLFEQAAITCSSAQVSRRA